MMNVIRGIGVALVALAFCITATAAAAWNGCGTFGGTDSAATISASTPCLCHDTASSTPAASTVISVAKDRQTLHVVLDPDVTGTGTGCEVQVYECTQPTTTSCHKVLGDTDGDGTVNDVTLDGSTLMRRGLDGVRARWLYVNVTANPSSHSCRTMVCGF